MTQGHESRPPEAQPAARPTRPVASRIGPSAAPQQPRARDTMHRDALGVTLAAAVMSRAASRGSASASGQWRVASPVRFAAPQLQRLNFPADGATQALGVKRPATVDKAVMEHIRDRHKRKAAAGASEFRPAFWEKLYEHMGTALDNGTMTANTGGRPGYIYEHQFAKNVGINSDAAKTPVKGLRVVVNDHKVVTAFPIP